MKPTNAGKDMCLRTQTANRKLKQNAQTQDVVDMQALPVLYMNKVKGYVTTILRFMIEWGKQIQVS